MPTIFFDFDSTIVSKESLDEVIEKALESTPHSETIRQQVEAITNAGMEGVIPFTESVKRRLALTSLRNKYFEHAGEELTKNITDGLPDLIHQLHSLKYHVYIVSGGFLPCLLPTAKKLGISSDRVFANTYQHDTQGYVIAPDTENPCFTDNGKVPIIKHITATAQPPRPYLMIGDGSNDLRTYTEGVVEFFCGFTAHVERDIIQTHAPHKVASVEELRDFIFTIPTV